MSYSKPSSALNFPFGMHFKSRHALQEPPYPIQTLDYQFQNKLSWQIRWQALQLSVLHPSILPLWFDRVRLGKLGTFRGCLSSRLYIYWGGKCVKLFKMRLEKFPFTYELFFWADNSPIAKKMTNFKKKKVCKFINLRVFFNFKCYLLLRIFFQKVINAVLL